MVIYGRKYEHYFLVINEKFHNLNEQINNWKLSL